MIFLIILFIFTSIALLGIFIVITYACLTTKSIHRLCDGLCSCGRARPPPIKYSSSHDDLENKGGYELRPLEKEQRYESPRFPGTPEIRISTVSSYNNSDEEDENGFPLRPEEYYCSRRDTHSRTYGTDADEDSTGDELEHQCRECEGQRMGPPKGLYVMSPSNFKGTIV